MRIYEHVYRKHIRVIGTQIQTGNSIPIIGLPAPGVGKIVLPQSASCVVYSGTVAFAIENDVINLRHIVDVEYMGSYAGLGNISPTVRFCEFPQTLDLDTIENTSLKIMTTADTDQGNGIVDIYISYIVIKL